MIDYCRAEILKSKRTFQRIFLLIGPGIFGVLLFFAISVEPEAVSAAWEHYTKLIFNFWNLFFNTVGISLICIFSEYRESQNQVYRSFFVEAKSLNKLWISKIMTQSFYCLIATIILIIFVSLIIIYQQLDLHLIFRIAEIGFLSWFVSLPVIPLVLFLTFRFGILASLASGIIGFILGPIMTVGENWLLYPYTYTIRAIVPLTQIHPNSTIILEANELLNTNVIIYAIVSTIFLLPLFSIITSKIFQKTEVR